MQVPSSSMAATAAVEQPTFSTLSQLTRIVLDVCQPCSVDIVPEDDLSFSTIIDQPSRHQLVNERDETYHDALDPDDLSEQSSFNQTPSDDNIPKPVLFRRKRNPFEFVMESAGNTIQGDAIILVVGDEKINTSKAIVCKHSDYFKAMFSTDMKESKQHEIELTDVDPKAVKQVINFCHKGLLWLSTDTAHNVLHTAHQFQIVAVIDACELFLSGILCKDNVMEILDLADHYCAKRLLKDVYRVLRDYFMELSIRDAILQLTFEQLLALLECDLAMKVTEYEIFSFVKKWISINLNERRKHTSDLLNLIKIPLMSKSELSRLSKTEEIWLIETTDFKEQMNKAFRYKNHINEQPLLQSWQTQPRGARDCLMAFSETDAILRENHTLSCGIVTFDQGSTEVKEHDLKLHWCRDEYAIAVWNNFLFVAGGYDPVTDSNLSSVHRFDPAMGCWTRVQSMLQRRACFFLGNLGEKLFAIGGRQHDNALQNAFHTRTRVLMSVEAYNCREDSWMKYAPLPNGQIYAHSGAQCRNKLYICGGRSDQSLSPQDTNAMLCYDGDSDSWNQCPRMQWSRYYHSVICHCDRLYVIGGLHYDNSTSHNVRWNFVADVECFDPATNQWTGLQSMLPHRRTQAGAASLRDTIYILGGLPYPGVDGREHVMEYDINTNKWRTSEINYPTLWPTTCCVLKLKPDFLNKYSLSG